MTWCAAERGASKLLARWFRAGEVIRTGVATNAPTQLNKLMSEYMAQSDTNTCIENKVLLMQSAALQPQKVVASHEAASSTSLRVNQATTICSSSNDCSPRAITTTLRDKICCNNRDAFILDQLHNRSQPLCCNMRESSPEVIQLSKLCWSAGFHC